MEGIYFHISRLILRYNFRFAQCCLQVQLSIRVASCSSTRIWQWWSWRSTAFLAGGHCSTWRWSVLSAITQTDRLVCIYRQCPFVSTLSLCINLLSVWWMSYNCQATFLPTGQCLSCRQCYESVIVPRVHIIYDTISSLIWILPTTMCKVPFTCSWQSLRSSQDELDGLRAMTSDYLEKLARFDSDGIKFKSLNPVEASLSSSPDSIQSHLSHSPEVARLWQESIFQSTYNFKLSKSCLHY